MDNVNHGPGIERAVFYESLTDSFALRLWHIAKRYTRVFGESHRPYRRSLECY